MKCFIFSLFVLIPVFLFAQNEEEKQIKTIGIGLVPQYAIVSGIRTDLEFRLHKKGQWIVVAPQFYINTGQSNLWDFKEMIGAGIELQHKIYFKDKPVPRGFYFAYGPLFQYYSVQNNGLAPNNFIENNTEYIGLEDKIITTNITKFGANLIFGIQTQIIDDFYLDFYLGTGVRLSYDNLNSGLHNGYNETWLDMGYSGTLLVGGIKLGVSLD